MHSPQPTPLSLLILIPNCCSPISSLEDFPREASGLSP